MGAGIARCAVLFVAFVCLVSCRWGSAPIDTQSTIAPSTSPTTPPATSRIEVTVPSREGMPEFPDLDTFTTADANEYRTYSSYATTGLQFVAPAGYRCRMSANRRATSSAVQCWGSLPLRGFNSVWADANAASSGANSASFGNIDLSIPEATHVYPGGPTGTVSPDAYRSLPSGMKLIEDSVFPTQCVVREQLTACLAQEFGTQPGHAEAHGFVLSPEGSWTF